MKYAVTAQSFNRKTGQQTGNIRIEVIDTESNYLFHTAKNFIHVKEIYEAFWNDINPASQDVVFVQKVERSKQ